jgi:tetratricopeptide (TPR) repeat protein
MRRLVAGLLLAGALATGAAHADSLGDVRTGNAAFGDGRYQAAVEAFTRAVLAGDLDHEALAITLNNRGVAYSELGDYDRAIADYQQGLALVPGDPTATRNLRIAYTRRAAAAARLGDRAAALADYDRAIELEPTHPLAYLRRGQLALERGDRAAAIADLTRARDLDPQNADVAALLAGAERMPTTPTPTEAPPPVVAPPTDQAAEATPPAAAAPADDYSIDPPARSAQSAPSSPDIAPAAGGPGRQYRALADVNVRAGPGNDYARVGGITEGAAVMVVGERLGWLQLRLDGGDTGWVYGKWLQEAGDADAGQQ